MELQGVPTVTFCTVAFRALVDARRRSFNLPEMPVVFLPHPMMTLTAGEIETLADEVLDEVIRGLTAEKGKDGAK